MHTVMVLLREEGKSPSDILRFPSLTGLGDLGCEIFEADEGMGEVVWLL